MDRDIPAFPLSLLAALAAAGVLLRVLRVRRLAFVRLCNSQQAECHTLDRLHILAYQVLAAVAGCRSFLLPHKS